MCGLHWSLHLGLPVRKKRSDMKKVYFIEHQLEMPNGAQYLPLASGLLASFMKKHLPDQEFAINAPIVDPSAVAFSVSLWNFNYSINKALEIKRKYPDCRVVFGGPSASKARDLTPFDIIEGEGEAAFLKWFSGIDTQINSLDDIPSPYISGVFDGMIGTDTQAIIETNRGCPFGCAYCFWGKGSKAVKHHSIEYVRAEAEWMGQNKIKYVFCADGNFGMFPRDQEIARIYADVKKRYGYPEKFRVCYGKNAEKSVFETASVLSDAGLSKSVTLSPQTRNTVALGLIGRQNIKDTFFDEMQSKYDNAGIPVYSELILGLPGETYESFKDGLLKTMRSGNQLFIYFCESLPDTKIAEPAYRRENEILTKKTLLTPVHCKPMDPAEYEDIIVATKTMPMDDWKRCAVLAWMVQLYYSMKVIDKLPEDILEFCLGEIEKKAEIPKYFDQKAEDVIKGLGRCDLINGVYFEPEEAMFLKHFCEPRADPVEQIIYARKNNFKKKEAVCT